MLKRSKFKTLLNFYRAQSEQKGETSKSSSIQPKIAQKSKEAAEEDANLSLVSYEESERANEKYYNEEELVKIFFNNTKGSKTPVNPLSLISIGTWRIAKYE